MVYAIFLKILLYINTVYRFSIKLLEVLKGNICFIVMLHERLPNSVMGDFEPVKRDKGSNDVLCPKRVSGNNYCKAYFDSCRITTARNNTMYYWLKDMYSATDITSFNSSEWIIGNVTMLDVFLQNAHQKEDMIASWVLSY